MFDDYPQTLAAIQSGIDRKLHTGVQIYVSIDGKPLLNAGIGQANATANYDENTISLWRSAGKPLTAVAILQLIENSDVTITSTLAELLPSTAGTPVGSMTLQQILTHSSGLPIAETGWPQADWEDILKRIVGAHSLSPAAAYQPQATWFLLGAILERHHESSFGTILSEKILSPLNMTDSMCGIPKHRLDELKPRLPQFWTREKGQRVPSPFGEEPWLTNPSPGGNFRGPVAALGKFYEMLMRRGRSENGREVLSAESVGLMVTRHRVGEFDETLQHIVDFGLGVIVDSNHHGVETVPYGFGRYCSRQTFGHGGSQCAMGFCDPERQLVVCWAANGFCGEGQHQRRNRAINEAVYTDLGFA